MSKNLVKSETRGNIKVNVYYDECPECPCKEWDMGAKHFFTNECGYIHSESNWDDLFSTNSGKTPDDVLRILVEKYVPVKDVITYLRKTWISDNRKFSYDRKEQKYTLTEHGLLINSFEPNNLKNDCYENIYGESLLTYINYEELAEILEMYGKNIVVKFWSSTGYSQGDYTRGISYCTLEMLDKYSGHNKKDFPKWQDQALTFMEGEIKSIGKWMWGDVYGFITYKGIRRHISYPDNPEKGDEEDTIWEEVDSCWGFYEDVDEVIEEGFSDAPED